jgi:hypothetical protein
MDVFKAVIVCQECSLPWKGSAKIIEHIRYVSSSVDSRKVILLRVITAKLIRRNYGKTLVMMRSSLILKRQALSQKSGRAFLATSLRPITQASKKNSIDSLRTASMSRLQSVTRAKTRFSTRSVQGAGHTRKDVSIQAKEKRCYSPNEWAPVERGFDHPGLCPQHRDR